MIFVCRDVEIFAINRAQGEFLHKLEMSRFYVLRWKEPSNLIPEHLYKDGLRHIHPDPEQARSITVREAARLQTFPDDYEFISGSNLDYKMIRNAVPLFAKIIADNIYTLLFERSTQ